MGRTSNPIEELCELLLRLSLSADQQAEYLRELDVWPLADELALEFEDTVRLMPKLVEDGKLNLRQQNALEELDRRLGEMSEKEGPDIWHVDRLNDPKWNDVRRLARVARELLEC